MFHVLVQYTIKKHEIIFQNISKRLQTGGVK
jgi:hypothetical protein